MANKELKQLQEKYEPRGWLFVKGRKHTKAVFENGRVVFMASTPSDMRAIKNIESALKRIEREYEAGKIKKIST